MHNAPRVRLTLAMLSFVQTPLFKGNLQLRLANFLFPLMHVETVAESIGNALYSGHGRKIYMPGIMRYVASLVIPLLAPQLVQRNTDSSCRKAGRIGSSASSGLGRKIWGWISEGVRRLISKRVVWVDNGAGIGVVA